MDKNIEITTETPTTEVSVNTEQPSIMPHEKWDGKTLLMDLIYKARFLSKYPLNGTVKASANDTLEELCKRLDIPIFLFPDFFQSCR